MASNSSTGLELNLLLHFKLTWPSPSTIVYNMLCFRLILVAYVPNSFVVEEELWWSRNNSINFAIILVIKPFFVSNLINFSSSHCKIFSNIYLFGRTHVPFLMLFGGSSFDHLLLALTISIPTSINWSSFEWPRSCVPWEQSRFPHHFCQLFYFLPISTSFLLKSKLD